MAKRYKGFKNKNKYKKGKRKLKSQLSIALKDKKLSKRELKTIRSSAKKGGYQGSSKRLANLIKKSSKSVKPKAFKKGRIKGVSVKKNTKRLKTIKQVAAQTPFLGPSGLKDPTKPDTPSNFPTPTVPETIGPLKNMPEVREVKEQEPIVFTPEPHVDPPDSPRDLTPPPTPTPTEPKKVKFDPPPTPEIDWAALLKASQNTNDLLTKQLSQPQQSTPAPTINVNMPETPDPEEALGRAKSTSSYLSGGSAGGIRRRRSNRSKLGLSGLGTNQLNRNVSNLLSIRGISI